MSDANIGNADFQASITQPSPVYPDLVAMPLLSNERCYGPWMSASIIDSNASVRYSNIGGKVEFVKDENLAPWNFAGYQLMNEAGSLQAQFSNSLLLFGEKGSFSMPEAPTGLSIAAALKTGGPLVTSINVSVGDSSIRTSVNMDLYTSRFGKLQKQKEELIGKISRERQKIIDQNNSMVRQGIGKSFSNVNLAAPLLQTGEILERAKEDMDIVVKQLMANQTVSFKSRVDVTSARGTDGSPTTVLNRGQSAATEVDSETIAANLSSSARGSLEDKRFNKKPNDDIEIFSTDGRSSSQFADGEGMDNMDLNDVSDLFGEQIV